jgi:Alpha 1,4-glycosyltransferase conserved region
MTHEFRSLWIGECISPLEYLSIQSFLANGHRYVLYSYHPVAGLPPGCTQADAREVLPEDRVFFYSGVHSGSPAGFANLFRYKLLFAEGGWWVDTDVVCLRSSISETQYVFAPEDEGRYTNAILRAPKGSSLASLLLEQASNQGADFEWGTTGPVLLTRVIDQLGLSSVSWPRSALYPWNWREALTVLDPRQTSRLEKLMQDSTFLHFWNEKFRTFEIDKTKPPPEGSVLDSLYCSYEVPFARSGRYTVDDLAPTFTRERNRLVAAIQRGEYSPD